MQFDMVCRRRHWGEDRVVYVGPNGAASLDFGRADRCRSARRSSGRLPADRAAFRTVDLFELCALLERLVPKRGWRCVNPITPACKCNHAVWSGRDRIEQAHYVAAITACV